MKYLIEFTPVGSFAFSGETSLTNPGEINSRRASYLADSEFLPPQTTILGTLRRAVLEWTGQFRADGKYGESQEFTKDIGEKAFSLDDECFSLGKIKSISSVFITRHNNEKTQYIFPAPRNAVLPPDENDTHHFHPMAWDACKRANDEQAMPDYNVKKGWLDGFVALDASPEDIASNLSAFVARNILGAEIISQYNLFKKSPQTAVRQADQEDNKGFRIHHRVYFTGKHDAFAVVADLEDLAPDKSLLVSMGARNSLFRVTATPLPKADISISEAESSCCMAVLSPMKLPENWRSMVDFAILGRQKIRQMKRKGNSFAYQHDSTLRFFASPGSVFYLKPDQRDHFISAITRQTALRNAGFNQYIMLNEEAKQ